MSLYEKTAHEIAALLETKEVSSEEITKSYLSRIEEVESKVDSFITICKDSAIEKAKEVDAKRGRGEKLQPLAGVPIAIKDNMCTKGIKTTCASKILHNFVPPYNATVVEKINSSDMILLGKLNMDEFAMGSSTENSSIKITKNPWDLTRVPGGSSGGSAASVAASETPISLGSDTGGSIRQPAHFCGVVGMKPTYGRVSRFGLVAFASSLDQIGPLTRDIEDMAMILNVICGYDKMDSTSVKMDVPDFTTALRQSVKGMKVALPVEFLGEGMQEDVRESVLQAAKVFESLGATVENVHMEMTDYALPSYYIISSAEASSNLARFDGIKYGYRAPEYENLMDLYKETRDQGFGPEVKRRIMLGTYALSSGYYDAYYKKAQQVRTLIKRQFDGLFQKFDVILAPTAPTTAFKIGENSSNPLEMYLGDIYSVPLNIAGLPGLTMPSGFDRNGLPIGIQLIGKPFDEMSLLRIGHAFEQESKVTNRIPNL